MPYLDHAATTPMLTEVIDTMTRTMARAGNPSSLHTAGRLARRTVEESREKLAAALGARPSEVVFTSGGTEADNLAVKGIAAARREADPRRTRVLASSIEHHAIIDSVGYLVSQGMTVTWIEVDADGLVTPDALRAAIGDDPGSVALVTVMWANNEVGTVAPIAELAAVAHEHGIPFHTDAVQAVGALEVSFAQSGVDALTMTGHKLGGPYGSGALLLGRTVECRPLLHGGGQERDVRSGTIDTAGVEGLALATEIAVAERVAYAERVSGLRDLLVEGVRTQVPDAVVNGPLGRSASGRPGAEVLPGMAHFTFADCEGDSLLMLLDARGVECSTGSACSAGVSQPSHVLLAMGATQAQARGSLRFSLGHTSTRADVEAVLDVIEPVVQRARRAGLAAGPAPLRASVRSAR